MIKANVVLDHFRWKAKIRHPGHYIKKKLNKMSKIYFFKKKKQEFTILLTNNAKMRKLNNKFRKKNKITDVLSFPFNKTNKKNSYIGDIAISFEFVKKRSSFSNFEQELDKMWIHGYLHLIGYDHKTLKDFKKMNKTENLILRLIN